MYGWTLNIGLETITTLLLILYKYKNKKFKKSSVILGKKDKEAITWRLLLHYSRSDLKLQIKLPILHFLLSRPGTKYSWLCKDAWVECLCLLQRQIHEKLVDLKLKGFFFHPRSWENVNDQGSSQKMNSEEKGKIKDLKINIPH